MKIVELKTASQGDVSTTAEVSAPTHFHSQTHSQNSEVLGHKAYHELADFPVVEMDALAQLQSNIALLEDLQGRLAFVMREVRYVMKV